MSQSDVSMVRGRTPVFCISGRCSADVHPRNSRTLWSEFASSSWFTRGWTLQELLAPELVVFCNARWQSIGHQSRIEDEPIFSSYCGPHLQPMISHITGISSEYLNKRTGLKSASIAQRMSWASKRITTRVEDEAYSLLGIFGINMPLIYGEGRELSLDSRRKSLNAQWTSLYLPGTQYRIIHL